MCERPETHLDRRSAGPSRSAGSPVPAVLLACATWGCFDSGSSGGSDNGRGVLVIAVDALRADHVTGLGYDRETTPGLDRLASEGASFSQTFSTAPWLLPAHVSLLSGCDPHVALRYLPDNLRPSMVTLWNLPESAPHVAKAFLQSGYATAAFSDHAWVSRVHGLDAGFQDFFELDVTPGEEPQIGVEGIAEKLENWLLGHPARGDWFAYVHLHDLERVWRGDDPRWDTYFEPRAGLDTVVPIASTEHVFHAIPHRRWRGGISTLGQYEALYDGAIRRIDERLDRLFARLAQLGRYDDTTIVVVGAHGVGFGEGGIYLDHGLLADVDLRVPWVVRPADWLRLGDGLETSALASLLDVAPTLLDLHGITVPIDMQGVSQAPVLRAHAAGRAIDPVRNEALARFGFQVGFAVMDATHCYVQTMPWMVRSAELSVSWYGTLGVRDEDPREVLHERGRSDDVGHARAGVAADPERAARLRAFGEAFSAESEELRRRLQAVTWPTPPDPIWMGDELIGVASPGSPP